MKVFLKSLMVLNLFNVRIPHKEKREREISNNSHQSGGGATGSLPWILFHPLKAALQGSLKVTAGITRRSSKGVKYRSKVPRFYISNGHRALAYSIKQVGGG